jgi:myb proto-oncogene protein
MPRLWKLASFVAVLFCVQPTIGAKLATKDPNMVRPSTSAPTKPPMAGVWSTHKPPKKPMGFPWLYFDRVPTGMLLAGVPFEQGPRLRTKVQQSAKPIVLLYLKQIGQGPVSNATLGLGRCGVSGDNAAVDAARSACEAAVGSAAVGSAPLLATQHFDLRRCGLTISATGLYRIHACVASLGAHGSDAASVALAQTRAFFVASSFVCTDGAGGKYGMGASVGAHGSWRGQRPSFKFFPRAPSLNMLLTQGSGSEMPTASGAKAAPPRSKTGSADARSGVWSFDAQSASALTGAHNLTAEQESDLVQEQDNSYSVMLTDVEERDAQGRSLNPQPRTLPLGAVWNMVGPTRGTIGNASVINSDLAATFVLPPFANGSSTVVSFNTTLFATAASVMNGAELVEVPPNGLKFSVGVENWPFLDRANRLHITLNITREAVNGDVAETAARRRLRARRRAMGQDEHTFELGSSSAFKAWMQLAETAIADGANKAIRVSARKQGTGLEAVDLVLPAFNHTLVYDPVVGIDSVLAAGGVEEQDTAGVPGLSGELQIAIGCMVMAIFGGALMVGARKTSGGVKRSFGSEHEQVPGVEMTAAKRAKGAVPNPPPASLATLESMSDDALRAATKGKMTGSGRRWTPYEDELLRRGVVRHGEVKWKLIAEELPDRNHVQCFHRWTQTLKPGVKAGAWTKEEDALIIQLKQQEKETGVELQWRQVSELVANRSTKQCRERWRHFLDPDVKRGKWSAEEDAELYRAHAQLGNKWTEIATRLPGRTQLHIRDRWRTIGKRSEAVAQALAAGGGGGGVGGSGDMGELVGQGGGALLGHLDVYQRDQLGSSSSDTASTRSGSASTVGSPGHSSATCSPDVSGPADDGMDFFLDEYMHTGPELAPPPAGYLAHNTLVAADGSAAHRQSDASLSESTGAMLEEIADDLQCIGDTFLDSDNSLKLTESGEVAPPLDACSSAVAVAASTQKRESVI